MKTETANAECAACADTAEGRRLARDAQGADWRRWGPYLASGNGARCARTTAPTATPGTIFRTTTRAAAPIAGARTASPASATIASWLVPGAGAVERARPDPEGAAVRPDQRARAITARTSRNSTTTSTARRRHSYMRMLYKYPQAAFPYDAAGRGKRRARPPTSRNSS